MCDYQHDAQSLSHFWIFVTLWNVACHSPLSMGFPRWEYWSRLLFLFPINHIFDAVSHPVTYLFRTGSLYLLISFTYPLNLPKLSPLAPPGCFLYLRVCFCCVCYFFINLFFIAGQLLYRILLFSVKPQHESAIGIHVSLPFWNSLPSSSPSHPSRLMQRLCLSFLSHTTNFHWLSILHMVM